MFQAGSMKDQDFRRLIKDGAALGRAIGGLCAPAALLDGHANLPTDANGLASFDLRLSHGRVTEIAAPGTLADAIPGGSRIVLPCFADVHTHLDLGHVVDVAPNFEGTHFGAVKALTAYRKAAMARGEQWLEEDLERRMEFGLQRSYTHGTAALRTHLGSRPEEAKH